MSKDTGGAAFPRTAFDKDGTLTTFDAEFTGMTLRDYFAAHAPLEPQPWFKVTDLLDYSLRPSYSSKDAPDELKVAVSAYNNEEYGSPIYMRGEVWVKEQKNLLYEFDSKAEYLRLTRWPFAWADAMIEARKS